MQAHRFLALASIATACFSPSEDDDTVGTGDDTLGASAGSSDDDGSSDDGPDDDGPNDDDDDDGPTGDDATDEGPGDDTTSDDDDDDGTTVADTTDGSTGPTDDGTTTDESSTSGTAEPTEMIAFVTSDTFTAQALPDAAGHCQDAADAAGLPGTYLPWVSFTGFRPADDFAHFDGPYVLTDGSVAANDWADLTDGSLQHAIDHDENGAPVVMALVWTNTELDGTTTIAGSTPSNCSDFTSTDADEYGPTGRSNYTDDAWTEYDSYTCSISARFYCFQQ